MAELNLILLGPPGAGKGTQAERIREDFDLAYIATGDMLRQAVAEGTPLGVEAKAYMDAGDLVPDNVIIGVIVERMESGDALDGFLLDGFPRTIGQAEALDEALERAGRDITGVLLIDAPDDEIVRRISGRRVGPNSGRVYHVEFDPPQVEGKDDADGADLIQRDDDRPEIVQARLEKQLGALADVVEHYRVAGVLQVVDGRRPIAAVTNDLLDAIEPIPYWRTNP